MFCYFQKRIDLMTYFVRVRCYPLFQFIELTYTVMSTSLFIFILLACLYIGSLYTCI